MSRLASLHQLYLTRLREFYRQPARIFWVYGFPTILAVVLGLAFKNQKPQPITVDIAPSARLPIEDVKVGEDRQGAVYLSVHEPNLDKVLSALRETSSVKGQRWRAPIRVTSRPFDQAIHNLKTGKSVLVLEVTPSHGIEYHYDPTRSESVSARFAVDDALQRASGRSDPVAVSDSYVQEPGARYIDFLIPGLIALNTMGGGLWGIGFLLVNFRIAGLLKRFMATPMPRENFLLAILGARLTFLIPDVGVLLALGVLAFQMPMRGSFLLLILVEVVGALAFSGIGLLVASRAKTTETVSGLMNLVMVPMWLLSGVFFSTSRYPDAMQPFIAALPLTQLCDGLRMVLLEGVGISALVIPLAIMSAWAVVTFFLALRIFRWT